MVFSCSNSRYWRGLIPVTARSDRQQPTAAYNAMIHGLAPYGIRGQGDSTWTLVDQQTGMSTGDMTVQFGSQTPAGRTESVQFDNFLVVPEPTTMGLLGLGGVVALIRRRR